jgi:hypothetical protein
VSVRGGAAGARECVLAGLQAQQRKARRVGILLLVWDFAALLLV